MKTLIKILLSGFMVLQLPAQTCKTDSSLNQISGRIEHSGIVHGGVYRGNEQPEPMPGFSPMPDFTMLVIRSRKNNAYVYCSFTSGKDGNFSLSLPNGKYGLWPGNIPMTNANVALGPLPSQAGNSWTSEWNCFCQSRLRSTTTISQAL